MFQENGKEQNGKTKAEEDKVENGSKVSKKGQSKKSHKKITRSQIIAIIAIVLVGILVGVILYLLFHKDNKEELQGKATIVTEDNVDEIIKSKGNSDDYYTATMTNEWTFQTGSSASEGLYIANVKNNKRTVYFDLLLKESQEKIYSSPYIPVGGEIDSIKLDKTLNAGDYDVIVRYHLVDDEKNELTTVSVAAVIHILK